MIYTPCICNSKTNLKMELSNATKSGLMLINNVGSIPNDILKKLLENAVLSLKRKPETHNSSLLGHSKADVVKECYAALLTFLTEAARHDYSREKIFAYLSEDLKINTARSEMISAIYFDNKVDIRYELSMIGSHLPHIVDTHWKLDYVTKTSLLNQTQGPIFRIQLSTETFNEKDNKKEIKLVHFNCNVLQLHDLVSKLKDITRHCEKIANSG